MKKQISRDAFSPNLQQVEKALQLLFARWPNAHCELVHTTPFSLALAVMLSAQTTDKAVNQALEPLLARYPDLHPKHLLELGEERFFSYIQKLGLARTKAMRAIELSRALVERYGGELPRRHEDLESLAGIGRKSAHVIRNVLWGEPVIAVDTHVARVAYRLGWVSRSKPPLLVERELMACVPQEAQAKVHHVLIFHGRYLCKARRPDCAHCVVAEHKLCKYYSEICDNGKSHE